MINMNFEIPLRLFENWLRTRLFKGSMVRPVILSYFVTFRCNLKCSFCDYTDPAFRSRYPDVSTDSAIRLLEIARQETPSLAISGGEPLLRDDIVEIVRAARHFGTSQSCRILPLLIIIIIISNPLKGQRLPFILMVTLGLLILVGVVVYAVDKQYKPEEQKEVSGASGQQGKAMEDQQAEALLMELSTTKRWTG